MGVTLTVSVSEVLACFYLYLFNVLMHKPTHVINMYVQNTFQNSEITMEVGGWVQISLGFCFILENHPKIALNQY